MHRKPFRSAAAGLLAAAVLLSAGALPGASREVELRDGLLYVPPGDYDRQELLERVAEAAAIEIVIIAGPPGEGPVSVATSGIKPEAFIRSLLKGGSYALLYRGASGTLAFGPGGGLAPPADGGAPRRSDDAGGAPAAGGMESAAAGETAAPEGLPEPERELLERIAALKARIASGASDRAYEIWSTVREPRFVVHDEELLEQFEKELAQLRADR
jgi:hypothetical protein